MKGIKINSVWKIALHVDISMFLFGLSCGVVNSISEPMILYYGWPADSSNLGICNTLYPFGALIGAIISGTVVEKYGRRGGILAMDLFFIVGAFIALMNFTEAMFLSRFITGIGAGMVMSVNPMFTNEYTPEELNEKIGPWMALFCASGFIFAYIFGLLIEIFGNFWLLWMGALQVIVIPVFYQAWWVLGVQKLDTPLWYFNNNQPEKSLEALELIYSEEKAKEVYERYENKHKSLQSPLLSSEKLTFTKVLCEKQYSRMLRCGLGLCIFQQFSGINAVLMYSNTMFEKMNISRMMSKVMTIIIGFTLLGADSLAIPVLKIAGRKTIMVTCAALLFLNLSILGTIALFDEIPGIAKGSFIFLYLIIFSVSFGGTMWMYCGEFLNEKAMSLSASSNFLANCVVNFAFDYALVSQIPLSIIFYFFAGCMLLSAIHSQVDLIETRGLTHAEIDSLIKS